MARTARKREPQIVTQADLVQVFNLNVLRAETKKHLANLDKAITELETPIIQQLHAGGSLEAGEIGATVVERSVVRPKWKELFIEYNGFEKAHELIEATEPTVSVSLELTRA
jgi:hypothetical protein